MRLQGRKSIRGTTLIILKERENHSWASSKALPYNGGYRVSLLAFALTRPTREGECSWSFASAHTNRRLSVAFEKGMFSVIVFWKWLCIEYIKSLNFRFVKMEFLKKCNICLLCKKRKSGAYLSLDILMIKNHLTFEKRCGRIFS